MNTKTFTRGNLTVTLDKDQVFPDDPGAGTPAMVTSGGKHHTTYWCAVGEGELDGKQLTEKQVEWLESLECAIEDFLY